MRSFLLNSSSGSSKSQLFSATCQHKTARIQHTGVRNQLWCLYQQATAISAHLQVPNAWAQQQADGSMDGQVQQQQQQQHSSPLAEQQHQKQQQPEQSAVSKRQPDTALSVSSEAPLAQEHAPGFATSKQEQHQQQRSQQDNQQQQQQQQEQSSAEQTGGAVDQPTAADGAGNDTTHTLQAWGSTNPPAEPDYLSQFTYFYTPYVEAISEPVPVQTPPPNASTQPTKPFFASKKYIPPGFLKYYAAPPDGSYNFLSFLGELEPAKGKFLAVGGDLDAFLTSYYRTVALANRRMFLAESYQDQPFKFYQELDFDWSLDPQLVLQLIPQVVDVVRQEVARVHEDQIPHGTTPKAVLSMRTIYKVHINFPSINTMEAKAGVVRKAVINRCRAQLSGQPPLDKLKAELVVQEHWQEARDQLLQLQQLVLQLQDAGQQLPAQAQQLLQEHQQLLQSAQRSSTNPTSNSTSRNSAQLSLPAPALPQQQQQQELPQQEAQQPQSQQQLSLQEQQQQLDWESIVDFPHGSLRLLGSCKSPWMDGDPEWVTEKAYSPVQCVDGVWMRQPLTLAAVMECSIQLQEGELRVFEQAGEFLEVVFQAAQQREEVLAAKRIKRAAKKQIEFAQLLLQDPTQQLPGALTGHGRPMLTPEEKAAKAERQKQRRLEEEQRRAQEAAEKAQQAQRKAEALARLQASAASSRPVLQRPRLSRPPQPPIQPPPSS